MTWITALEHLPAGRPEEIGGKGAALFRLRTHRLRVPTTLCITTRAYRDFIEHAGLREKIHLELHRKVFTQMRWEEVWDASQRIRLMFLRSPMPPALERELAAAVAVTFGDAPVAVRSSAPEEDRSGHSFAGLHSSYTHLRGVAPVIQHLRMVWASLWSDAALLYRQELGLDTATSAMAVLVQSLVAGEASGILFTQDPTRPQQGIVEAVHGLNPPLVDGKISPDRWIIDARSGTPIDHTAPETRDRWQSPRDLTAADALTPLPPKLQKQPPLNESQLATLWETGRTLAEREGTPQDIEWTFCNDRLVLLQARPITAAAPSANGDSDPRAWYLSLHRSLENLLTLRQHIETDLIPGMQAAAQEMAAMDPKGFDDTALAAEIRRRWEINQRWAKVYWDDFIPFAHGMRLFGQIYNEVMQPEDPYAFMTLLKNQDLLSLQRNRALARLADGLRDHPERREALAAGGRAALDGPFRRSLEAFIRTYGDLSCTVTGAVDCIPDDATLPNLLLEMAKLPKENSPSQKEGATAELESEFFQACPLASAEDCRALLSVARASYRLRDDDNIILGAIEAQLIAAAQEGRRRAAAGSEEVAETLTELGLERDRETPSRSATTPPPLVVDRQITGQPAGPGLARGRARVIQRHADIANFKKGEIIVCDGVDPNMTFVMPLAAGIVERRGGMLIHGAIIAREYGLPCVTGVVAATDRIRTGQQITVDGYLGIVTLGETDPAATQRM
ncbi:MAG: PEP/pyruvate-binding domain-containing protein [Desulfosarcinaceae bacterium]|nr:PEP/pyruvate-binding domain-containing protein [Desulfosarcinaceae bacterium]